MRRLNSMFKVIMGLLFLFVLVMCSSEDPAVSVSLRDGQQSEWSADSVTWKMVYINGNKVFPIYSTDEGAMSILEGYWIGEKEVTFELWKKVYDWATTDTGGGKRADGGVLYIFANPGTKGNDGGAGKSVKHPVTTLNWRDALVFCNALTEWYNAQNGTNYIPVYWKYGILTRNSTNTSAEESSILGGANGFRLPGSMEWELAARWKKDSLNTVSGYSDPSFTKGDSASGATGNYENHLASGEVAWYSSNSGSATQEVGLKKANDLGLYDISGNVSEWGYDITTVGYRGVRGGNWFNSNYNLQLGLLTGLSQTLSNGYTGLRVARSEN